MNLLRFGTDVNGYQRIDVEGSPRAMIWLEPYRGSFAFGWDFTAWGWTLYVPRLLALPEVTS